MAINKGRTITVNVTQKIIDSGKPLGHGLYDMVYTALRQYKASNITSTGLEFTTKSNHVWSGVLPKRVAKKLAASTALKSRPFRIKPFSFDVVVFRGGTASIL